MPRRIPALLIPVSLLALGGLAAGVAHGGNENGLSQLGNFDEDIIEEEFIREPMMEQGFGFGTPFGMSMIDPAIGESTPPTGPGGNQGSTIVAVGADTVVIDEDSGDLVRLDKSGAVSARASVGAGAAQMVKHGDRLFVADRANDRVRVFDLSKGLTSADVIDVPAEPFGVAIAGNTLLVTSVADQRLTGIDLGSMSESFSTGLAPEPRGVAVSPDGKSAIVTFLTMGAVAKFDLTKQNPSARYVSLDPTKAADAGFGGFGFQQNAGAAPAVGGKELPSIDVDPDIKGRSYVRNAFAVAYVGHGLSVVPHQLSTPVQATNGSENVGSYGGGFASPVEHRLAFIPGEGGKGSGRVAMATLGMHQPRALSYHAPTDTLYVVGMGSDQLMAIADVSQSTVHMAWQTTIQNGGSKCGPNGVDVDENGDARVFCSFTREVATVSKPTLEGNGQIKTTFSAPVSKSLLSKAEQRGREVFFVGNDFRISTGGAMACASCHAEGRTDGLSWRIEGNTLQTPLLAGRVEGTHPFKWDGQDKDLHTSLTNTVKRLGGSGLSSQEASDLQAFVLTLEPPRAPTAHDKGAVARGKQIFESSEAGCESCHGGDKYADGESYALANGMKEVDTPSLIGLAHTAPYYHDGSARTLRALLLDNATVHDMGSTVHLEDKEVDDLVAYLETL